MMKVLVIGYGSMGRRRIRLLGELLDHAEIHCVDSNSERRQQAAQSGIRVYDSLDMALEQRFDLAFVCTSPGHHAEIILKLIEKGISVFTELNLTNDKYEDMIREAKAKDVNIFMSSTLLYNKQIEKIGDIVKKATKPLNYVYHVGQYLPDWHPWESYKDFFIGKKETNGVRELYAVQLPWIVDVFGKIESVTAYSQRCTDLEIDFPDCVTAFFRHKNGHMGTFVVDVVSRKATTYLEIIGEELHIFWGGHNDDLFFYDTDSSTMQQFQGYEGVEHVDGYADNIIENPYKDEIKDFLSMVADKKKPKYSLEKDGYVLSIIDKIEGAGT